MSPGSNTVHVLNQDLQVSSLFVKESEVTDRLRLPVRSSVKLGSPRPLD